VCSGTILPRLAPACHGSTVCVTSHFQCMKMRLSHTADNCSLTAAHPAFQIHISLCITKCACSHHAYHVACLLCTTLMQFVCHTFICQTKGLPSTPFLVAACTAFLHCGSRDCYCLQLWGHLMAGCLTHLRAPTLSQSGAAEGYHLRWLNSPECVVHCKCHYLV
jgi:hypothetical protein